MLRKLLFSTLVALALSLSASGSFRVSALDFIPPCANLDSITISDYGVPIFHCGHNAYADWMDIKMPTPAILGTDPHIMAMVGVPFIWSIGWADSSFTTAAENAIECSEGFCGFVTDKVVAEDVIPRLRFDGLRTIIQIRNGYRHRSSCVFDLNDTGVFSWVSATRRGDCGTLPGLYSGNVESWSFFGLDGADFYERSLPGGMGGLDPDCTNVDKCGRTKAYFDSKFPPLIPENLSVAYQGITSANWFWFVSNNSSMGTGNTDGHFGEPAVYINVTSDWDIFGKVLWDAIYERRYVLDHREPYTCTYDRNRDGEINSLDVCFRDIYEWKWIFVKGAGSQAVVQLFDDWENPMFYNSNWGVYDHRALAIGILQSQPLLEIPVE